MIRENSLASTAITVHPQTSSPVDPPYLSVVLPVYQEREVIGKLTLVDQCCLVILIKGIRVGKEGTA